MLTTTQHRDLTIRLLTLVAELAPASDRARAEARVTELLARIPADDSDPFAQVHELEAELAGVHAAKDAAAAAAAETIARLEAELAAAKAPPPSQT